MAGRVDGLASSQRAYVDTFEGAYTTAELSEWQNRDNFVWGSPADENGQFRAEGFTPGVYTVMVSISLKNATTASARRATHRTASQVVSLFDEEIVEIQFSAR